jgi:hypothetical protein
MERWWISAPWNWTTRTGSKKFRIEMTTLNKHLPMSEGVDYSYGKMNRLGV